MAATSPEQRKLISFLDGLDQDSKARKNLLVGEDKYGECLRLFRGKMPVPQTNPLFQANFIGVEIERKAALLAENKPELRIDPRRNGLKETAEVLQNVLRADWDEQNMGDVLETGIVLMEILGALILGIEWDAQASYGIGALKVFSVDPRCFRISPDCIYAQDLDDAQAVMTDSLVPLFDVRRQHPGIGMEVKADPRSSLFPADDRSPARGPLGSMANVLRNVLNPGEKSAGVLPMAYVRTYKFKDPTLKDDGTLMFPFGRFVKRGGDDVILADDPNPYFDGGWPYVMTNGRLDPNHPWGRSEAEGLRRLSEAVNRIGHLFVDNTIRGGSGHVIIDADALAQSDKNTLSNIGMQIISKKFGREVKWEGPIQMPPHMLDFIRFAMQLFDVLTGMSDSAGLRKEVRSGAMLEGLQTQAQTLVRQQARRIEGMLERLGQKWISRIFQFYQDDRLMTMVDGDKFIQYAYQRQSLLAQLANEAAAATRQKIEQDAQSAMRSGQLAVLPTDEQKQKLLKDELINRMRGAWRDFRFRVTPGSSLASTKMQRAVMWGELAKNRLASPKHVLKELGVDNPEEEIKEAIEYQRQLMEAGVQPPDDKGKGTRAQQGITAA